MTTNDFVRRCLGLCGDKVDEILDKFDLELDEDDVTRALSVCYPRFDEFGNYLISDLYQRVIDEAVESLGFDERKFDYFVNGNDCWLMYDHNGIYSWKQLIQMSKELDND